MQALNIKGHIVISDDIESEVTRLEGELKPFRVVKFVVIGEVFKLEHAKAVLAESYISESTTKYIIIGSSDLSDVAQNSLLKLLEEPPKNIEFIIISPTKSNLLRTVRSRLPILKINNHHVVHELELNLARLDYKDVFSFLKEHSRVKKEDAKELVQALFHRATVVDMLILSPLQLDNFDMAYRLLSLNSRPQSVLAMLLMSFAREK
ncbi:DNA polymerase III subunit delta' [Sulfurimonas sp. SAG-AH-194-C20]|nr:DNA polymerase III subunit delta' [Sulfurimonas sp. SAG-AH-194-C20]MDF1878529.1 DNA polymerase III subunit delta' [Sulfurimonas sp. SAG-AH-194-C20]